MNFNRNYLKMKKLLFVLAIALSFTSNSMGQNKKVVSKNSATTTEKTSVEAKAIQNLKDVESFVIISPKAAQSLLGLFITKHGMLQEVEGLPDYKRKDINRIIERKMEYIFDIPTYEKIKSNTVLFEKMIN